MTDSFEKKIKASLTGFKEHPIIKRIRSFPEAHLGSPSAIKKHRRDLKIVPTAEGAINIINQRWPEVSSNVNSNPIFILSAGWRSGSTLLQRLVMSSGSTIIWGEPYSQAGLIDNLATTIKSITDHYPQPHWFVDRMVDSEESLSALSSKFIANLYPNMEYLLDSQISFFLNLFEQPAQDKGFTRWGVKFVRLNVDHAIYLQWLFPKSKFLFLYRNPYNAYISYRGFYWYKRWPYEPVYKAKQFGTHWKQLTESFVTDHNKVNGMLVKYEDLCQGNFDFKALEDFLEVKLSENQLKNKVGSSRKKVSKHEIKILTDIVEPLSSELGYNCF